MAHEPHQQCVVDEKAALDDKHNKLRDFIGRDDFVSIVSDEAGGKETANRRRLPPLWD